MKLYLVPLGVFLIAGATVGCKREKKVDEEIVARAPTQDESELESAGGASPAEVTAAATEEAEADTDRWIADESAVGSIDQVTTDDEKQGSADRAAESEPESTTPAAAADGDSDAFVRAQEAAENARRQLEEVKGARRRLVDAERAVRTARKVVRQERLEARRARERALAQMHRALQLSRSENEGAALSTRSPSDGYEGDLEASDESNESNESNEEQPIANDLGHPASDEAPGLGAAPMDNVPPERVEGDSGAEDRQEDATEDSIAGEASPLQKLDGVIVGLQNGKILVSQIGEPAVDVVVDPDTRVFVNGQPASPQQLRTGRQVRVSYRLVDAHRVAEEIEQGAMAAAVGEMVPGMPVPAAVPIP